MNHRTILIYSVSYISCFLGGFEWLPHTCLGSINFLLGSCKPGIENCLRVAPNSFVIVMVRSRTHVRQIKLGFESQIHPPPSERLHVKRRQRICCRGIHFAGLIRQRWDQGRAVFQIDCSCDSHFLSFCSTLKHVITSEIEFNEVVGFAPGFVNECYVSNNKLTWFKYAEMTRVSKSVPSPGFSTSWGVRVSLTKSISPAALRRAVCT